MSVVNTKKKRGRPNASDPTKLKSVHITVCLTPHIKAKLSQIAESRGIPTATLMREVLEGYARKTSVKKVDKDASEESNGEE